MTKLRLPTLAALICCLAALGACSSGQSASDGIAGAVNKSVASALDQAEVKLRTEPIEVSHNDPHLSKAEITPKGDFIIDGKAVSITPAQRAALLEYRKQLISVAEQGIAIGKHGAAIGVHAAGAAIAAVFSGKSDEEIEQSVKAQTTGIREAAAKICDRLPAMMTEQQKLAAVLPEFRPYATMTQEDISDCRHDALNDDDSDSDRTRATVRDRIRKGIRSGVQTAAQATGLASNDTSDPETKAPAASSSHR